jgi:hypothetical protein
VAASEKEIMSAPWIALLFLVGVVSVFCYRLQNRRPRRPADSGSGVDFRSSSGSSSGWSFGDWFSSFSTDSSGNPTDSGG